MARDLLVGSPYDDLYNVIARAHSRTGQALRLFVALEETTLTPSDAALLDPSLKRALANLPDATIERHCERERNEATGRVECDDAAAYDRWRKL